MHSTSTQVELRAKASHIHVISIHIVPIRCASSPRTAGCGRVGRARRPEAPDLLSKTLLCLTLKLRRSNGKHAASAIKAWILQ
ncbi:hypothetical protein EVAR_93925_1 [Eumeta japonica]|uniref:Uncharacterized protein n=1 Tax=Eumeta variegata TaxID=151549 RepID=A0A4C1TP45_EUMVA|nr:hypothetical protein EVAR_93925_1 [Eumeta japonica]